MFAHVPLNAAACKHALSVYEIPRDVGCGNEVGKSQVVLDQNLRTCDTVEWLGQFCPRSGELDGTVPLT